LDNYDGVFYDSIHGKKQNHPIAYGSTQYEIPLIRHLAFCFWTNIKHSTTRDVIQKLSNRVMAHINQHDDRLANAVQCGVDKRQVQNLIVKLVDRTGVDVALLENLIFSKSTITITSSINDLEDEQIEQEYGINRDDLEKEKNQKAKELDQFRKIKKITMDKINRIKNNQFDETQIKYNNNYHSDDDLFDQNEETKEQELITNGYALKMNEKKLDIDIKTEKQTTKINASSNINELNVNVTKKKSTTPSKKSNTKKNSKKPQTPPTKSSDDESSSEEDEEEGDY